MTEHNRARRRPLTPRGRHKARPSAGSSRGSSRSATGSEPTELEATAALPSVRDDSAAPVAATRPDGAMEARARGRRRAEALAPGSLPRAAGWTILTSIIPGSGLLATRLRGLGIVLIVALAAVLIGVVAWFALGDPLPTLLGLASDRRVIIGALCAAVILGLIWVLQILATNVAHNGMQRLTGWRRALSTLLAVVLMGVTAMPFAVGANNLYSAQGLLGNTTVFGGKKDSRIGTGKDPWAGTARLNIMLLGQDAGADRIGTRPDTIMVASIDTKTGRTALFSLPRNLQYVRFPAGSVEAKAFPNGFDAYGKDENLINAVWQWGDEHKDLFPGDSNPGLTATRHAVEETMGLDMDYYGMVDLEGFQDLVDAIGGVDINVERRIPMGGGTNQATGKKYPITGWIEPGEQHLDGLHALWYARSREGSDDFNRMCRQQRMIRIVSEEADPVTLALAFPQLVTATENNIVTDIPAQRLDAFVNLAQRVKKSGFTSYPITHEVDAPGSNTWKTGGHPDWDYLHQWVQASIADSMTSTKAGSVKGTDGTATPSSPAASSSAAPSTTATPSESAEPSQETQPSQQAPAAPAGTPQINQDPLKSCLPAGATG